MATFWVRDLLFGVPVDQVQEVLHDQPETRVPLAPAGIRGVMNLRGRIITGIDLPQLLGERACAGGTNVIVRWEDEWVSLRADRIGEVIELDGAAPSGRREQLRDRARALVKEVYEWQQQLVLLLDTNAVVEMAWSEPADDRATPGRSRKSGEV
jgi:purine-binding chemotaxis protein CheW